LELIQGADVIFWDEAMANHRECLEAVLAVPELDCFKGILLARMHEYIVECFFIECLTCYLRASIPFAFFFCFL
jgi:hypothetical protein